ncbi:MAG: hypothetical protein HC793_02055 [Aquincola sp.]|nr:hypothetical protein [Aquincola sp.]
MSASLMARVVPPELVHEVLDAHACNSQRVRAFPAVAGVYYVMALSLYPEASYEAVFSAVSQGLAWQAGAPQPAGVSKVAISLLRSRIGAAPPGRLGAALLRAAGRAIDASIGLLPRIAAGGLRWQHFRVGRRSAD